MYKAQSFMEKKRDFHTQNIFSMWLVTVCHHNSNPVAAAPEIFICQTEPGVELKSRQINRSRK